MITISENVRGVLDEYFKAEGKRRPIRVLLSAGCHGAHLELVFDGPTEADSSYDVEGFTFCIDKEAEGIIGDLSIDINNGLFELTPEHPLPEVPGSCGSCCGSCGSHAEEEDGSEA